MLARVEIANMFANDTVMTTGPHCLTMKLADKIYEVFHETSVKTKNNKSSKTDIAPK